MNPTPTGLSAHPWHASPRWLGLLFLLCFSLCATPALAQENLRGRPIESIEFTSLKRLARGALINRIVSRVGKPFDPQTLTEDLGRLYSLGEFESPDGITPPIEVDVEATAGGGVRIVFEVHERRVLVDLRLVGYKAFKSSERDAIQSKVGLIYDPYLVEKDRERLEKKLISRGYANARVFLRVVDVKRGVRVIFLADSGPQITIDDYHFKGITFLEDPDDDLPEMAGFDGQPRSFLGFDEEGYFRRSTLDDDLKKVQRFFRSKGFLDVSATLDRYEFNDDRDEVVINVRVNQGRRYTVRKIDIKGNRLFSRADVRKRLKMRPGRPFLGNDLLADVRSIEKLYATKAYIHAKARFDVVYDLERKLADIVYSISEGPQVSVDRIVIEGNEKTKDFVIRNQLSIFPGDMYDSEKIEDSLGRLGRLRYFNDLNLDFRPGSRPGREDLVIRVQEARTGSFIVGGGVSTNAGFFGNIVLNQRNFDITDFPTSFEDILDGRAFTGAGQNFTISAQPGRERSQYRVSFTDPYFWDNTFILGFDAFIFDRIRPDYREGRLGFAPSLGYRLTQDLTARMTYRLERVRLFDMEFDATPTALRSAGNNIVSGLEMALILNRNLVDTQFVQYSGYGATVAYEVLGGPLGGDVKLSRARVQANWQTTLWEFPRNYKWVFGVRGRAAWQEAYGRGRQTPIFERFFAGGVRSFRGFEFRSVSPRDPVRREEPIGGDFQFLGTVDFSFPLYKGFLRGVTFMDFGTVEADIDDWSPRRIRYAPGFGFRFNVAIFPAPVALDFAFPIRSRRIDDEQVFSFFVGVGF